MVKSIRGKLSSGKSTDSIYTFRNHGGFKQYGVEAGRVNSRVAYDFEARSGYKGHNLNASVGLSF